MHALGSVHFFQNYKRFTPSAQVLFKVKGLSVNNHTLRGRNHSSCTRNIGQKWEDKRAHKPKLYKSSVMTHFYMFELVLDELLGIMNRKGLFFCMSTP